MTSHREKVDEGKNCDVYVSSPQYNVIYTYEESHHLIQCLTLSQLKPVTFFFCSQLYLFFYIRQSQHLEFYISDNHRRSKHDQGFS